MGDERETITASIASFLGGSALVALIKAWRDTRLSQAKDRANEREHQRAQRDDTSHHLTKERERSDVLFGKLEEALELLRRAEKRVAELEGMCDILKMSLIEAHKRLDHLQADFFELRRDTEPAE